MRVFNIVNTCLALMVVLTHSLHAQYKKGEYSFVNLEGQVSQRAITSIIQDDKGLIWMGTNGVGLTKYDGVNYTSYRKDIADSTSLSSSLVNTLFLDASKQLWVGTEAGLNLYDRLHDNFKEIVLEDDITDVKNQTIFSIVAHKNGSLLIGTADLGLFVLNPITKKSKKVGLQQPFLLSDFKINSIVEDGYGKMLVGTNQGLFVYNEEINLLVQAVFETKEGEKVIPNKVESLLIDGEGHLWVGTYESGLIQVKIYNDKSDVIQHYDFFDKRVLSMILGPEKEILCGTENDGLFVIDSRGKLLEHYKYDKSKPGSIKSNSIWSLYLDAQNRIWMGYYNQGVAVFDKFYDKFHSIKEIPSKINSLQSASVTGITQMSDGNFLIGMDGGGVDIYNPNTKEFIHLISPFNKKAQGLESSDVQAVFIDSKENIWIGTWNSGIYFLPKSKKEFVHYDVNTTNGGLSSNSITSIVEDSTGKILIGTFFLGLHVYNPQNNTFKKYETGTIVDGSSHSRYLRKVLVDKEDNIWLGTTKGLYKIERDNDERVEVKSLNDLLKHSSGNQKYNIVLSLLETKGGDLFIGTDGTGLCKFNPKNKTFKWYRKESGLKQETIAGIIEDRNGNIWVSGEAGISMLNSKTDEFLNFDLTDGLLANDYNYNATHIDSKGQLYFGSYEGVVYFDPDAILFNQSPPALIFTDLKLFNESVKVKDKDSPLIKVISETKHITLNHRQSVFSLEFVGINFTRGKNNQYAYYLEGFEKTWNYIGNLKSATYTNLSPGDYVFKVKAANNDGVWNNTPITLGITVLAPWWKTKWAFVLYFLLFSIITLLLTRYISQRVREKRLIKLERDQRRQEDLLNEKKIQFFTNISHEFRTPLTLILNPIKDLIATAQHKLDPRMALKHKTILKNANRLKSLMDELMDFRKLQMNKMPLHTQEINAVDFIEKVASYFNEEALEKNILFTVEGDGTETKVWGDPSMLEKVVFNLLSNAFKATPENGAITIGVFNSKKPKHFPLLEKNKLSPAIEIVVEDTGTGIKKEDLPHIFKRFYRSQDKTTGYYGGSGTGIGLEVAQGFIDLHKGKISVKSKAGKGTKFTVKLPQGANHLNTSSASEFIEYGIDDLMDTMSQPPAYLSNENEKDSKKRKVLIVEDNHELRRYLKGELSDKFTVIQVDNGQKGLEFALKSIPDIIITDVLMPEMDGFEFCQALKNEISTSHIPIIMLTAKTMDMDRIKGINAGADAYLTKPFEMSVLNSYLFRLIENRQIFINKHLNDPNRLNLLENTTSLDKSFIQKVLDYLNENIGKSDLNVEYLADDMHLSRSQLYRKIKALTGLTPNELIRKVRLEKAKILIENGSESVSEVGFKVGFSSPSYFSRCFKSQFGLLPTELKARES